MEDIIIKENHFRIRKFLRIITASVAILFGCFLVLDIWRYFLNDIYKFSALYFVVIILCTAALAHCAMSFSKTDYAIKNDALIAKKQACETTRATTHKAIMPR